VIKAIFGGFQIMRAESEPLLEQEEPPKHSLYNFIFALKTSKDPTGEIIKIHKIKTTCYAAFPLIELESQDPFYSQLKKDIDEEIATLSSLRQIDLSLLYDLLNKKIVLIMIKHLNLETKEEISRDGKILFIYVTASESTLIKLAAINGFLLQLRKQDGEDYDFQHVPPYGFLTQSLPRTFYPYFKHYEEFDAEVQSSEDEKEGVSLFTQSSKVVLIREMIERNIDLAYLMKSGFLSAILIMPNAKVLEELKSAWANPKTVFRDIFINPSLKNVKLYFGTENAMYFKWMNYTLRFSFAGAILSFIFGVIFYAFNNEDNKTESFSVGEGVMLIMAMAIPLLTTVYEKIWIEHQFIKAWHWGTYNISTFEYQSTDFVGTYRVDPVTEKIKKIPNETEREIKIRRYTVRVIMALFVLLVAGTTAAQFYVRAQLDNSDLTAIYIGIVTSVIIYVYRAVYGYVAKRMTDWENYEFYTDYVWRLSFRLFCFEFISNYSSLFYIAFFKGQLEGCNADNCIHELNLQLLSVFSTNCVIGIGQILVTTGFARLRVRDNLKELVRQRADVHWTDAEYQYALDS
jgi:hypothetical protein